MRLPDPAVLATFKRDPVYHTVLEHLSCEHGRQYLAVLERQYPELLRDLARYRRNDEIGAPRLCDYGRHRWISPTTLRYVTVLGHLQSLFGSLDGMDIIEIGGGYGGQCFVITAAARPASYTLIDLDPCLALQATYLAQLGVSARTVSARDLSPSERYSLVISNYAFSECTRRIQKYYVDRVLRRSERSFVTMNWITPRHFRGMTRDEMTAAIPGSEWHEEEPKTGRGMPCSFGAPTAARLTAAMRSGATCRYVRDYRLSATSWLTTPSSRRRRRGSRP